MIHFTLLLHFGNGHTCTGIGSRHFVKLTFWYTDILGIDLLVLGIDILGVDKMDLPQ